MSTRDISLGRVARTVGYAVLGFVGTAVLGMALLVVAQPLQVTIYDALYLAVGPWTAEETATVLQFALASLGAIGVITLVAAYARTGTEHLRTLAPGLVGLLALVAVFVLASALLGVVSFLAAIVAVAAFVVAVPVGLRAVGAWPAGVATFAGGVPTLAILLLLLGFGLGWGGGYDLVAREIPADEVDGTAEASFEDVPQLREDLLRPADDDVFAYCETAEGRRTCRLSLRGYDREAQAARFLDRHGVRCPFRGTSADEDRTRSFVATDDGTFYRVSCVSYGD